MMRLQILLVLSGFLSITSAVAHDWYPLACCSQQDCRELEEAQGETVSEMADGWHLWDGRVVDRGSAKLSPNKKYHLCERRDHSIICFFAPPGAS
jgi:hypothetical protein